MLEEHQNEALRFVMFHCSLVNQVGRGEGIDSRVTGAPFN